MLHELLTLHRSGLIARTRQKVRERDAPPGTEAVLEHGVPLFLDQLAATLRRELETPARPTSPEMTRSAILHGAELRDAGFTVGQVVHGYGDVCQAVTEYARQHDLSHPRGVARHGFFVHEQRNLLNNAILAFEVLKTGTVGVGGTTGGILGRNLIALRDLIDRSLVEVRLEAGLHHREHVSLSQLVEETGSAAAIEAQARGHHLTVSPVEPGVMIDVDRQLIVAALTNLLQNACKFSRANGQIVLRTVSSTTPDRVLIEVEDECGGLAPDQAEDLFRPFAQRSADRSGLGLGLAIARESVEVNGGEVRVRSLPGKGCVFTIDLPLLSREPAAVVSPTIPHA